MKNKVFNICRAQPNFMEIAPLVHAMQRSPFHWIEPGAHRFIADPFLTRLGETNTLFFEELLYFVGKGRLKALPSTLSGGQPDPKSSSVWYEGLYATDRHQQIPAKHGDQGMNELQTAANAAQWNAGSEALPS